MVDVLFCFRLFFPQVISALAVSVFMWRPSDGRRTVPVHFELAHMTHLDADMGEPISGGIDRDIRCTFQRRVDLVRDSKLMYL